jgi:cytochrome b
MTFEHDESAARTLPYVWDLPLRLTHWALALAVAGSWISHYAGVGWFWMHRLCGYTVLLLVAFRIVWGFTGSRHARFREFLRGPARLVASLRGRGDAGSAAHTALGGWSAVAMLAALAFQATSGLFANDEIASTGPLYGWVSHEVSNRWTGLHHRNADVLTVLIVLHVAAVAWYVLARRQPLLRGMITGRKPLALAPAPKSVRPRHLRAALIMLALGVLLVGAVRMAPEASLVLF